MSHFPFLGRSNSLSNSSSDAERYHAKTRSLRFTRQNEEYHRELLPALFIKPKPELIQPLQPHEGVARAIALYNFQAVESGDLSFSKGDVITIVEKSNSMNDWWSGKMGDRKGIFPANFVEVI